MFLCSPAEEVSFLSSVLGTWFLQGWNHANHSKSDQKVLGSQKIQLMPSAQGYKRPQPNKHPHKENEESLSLHPRKETCFEANN